MSEKLSNSGFIQGTTNSTTSASPSPVSSTGHATFVVRSPPPLTSLYHNHPHIQTVFATLPNTSFTQPRCQQQHQQQNPNAVVGGAASVIYVPIFSTPVSTVATVFPAHTIHVHQHIQREASTYCLPPPFPHLLNSSPLPPPAPWTSIHSTAHSPTKDHQVWQGYRHQRQQHQIVISPTSRTHPDQQNQIIDRMLPSIEAILEKCTHSGLESARQMNMCALQMVQSFLVCIGLDSKLPREKTQNTAQTK